MMGLFSLFKKKKETEYPFTEYPFNDYEQMAISTNAATVTLPIVSTVPTVSTVSTVPQKVKREQREAGSPIDYVTHPEDFRWFLCKCCVKKVLASKGEKMFFVNGDGYNVAPTKLCMECVADIAFEMGAGVDEIKKAEKRKVLRCLKGQRVDKNE